jgi:hypothetical protein
MPQKAGSKLPNRGEWLISNAITGKNAPFASLDITFAQNPSGRATGTCRYWRTTTQLMSITETEIDTFIAMYEINGERGTIKATYDPVHQTLDVEFVGRNTQWGFGDNDSFTARAITIEVNSHSISAWTSEERLQEAVRRALPLMPSDVAAEVGAMLTPKALAFMATVTLIWGAAQLYGGPAALVADILILIVGFAALGMQVYDVAEDIMDFAAARNAQSDQELDKAAAALAKAISIVGVNTIAIILFAKAPKILNEPYKPRSMPVRGRPMVEPVVTPSADIRAAHAGMRTRTRSRGWLLDTDAIQVDFNAELPSGVHGTTDVATGQIRISRALKGNPLGQTRALRHEQVHQFITRLASISEITLDLRVWAYEKSYMLRYLEEAIAELTANAAGGDGILAAFHFPIKNGYIEVRNASRRLARGLLEEEVRTGERINYEMWKLQLSDLDTKINAIERNGGRFLNQTELKRFYGQKAELEGLLKPFDDLMGGFIRIKGNGLRLKSYGRADPMLNEAMGVLLGECNVLGNFYRVFFSVDRPEASDPIPFSEGAPAALPR